LKEIYGWAEPGNGFLVSPRSSVGR
jgi:hypothetical protein